MKALFSRWLSALLILVLAGPVRGEPTVFVESTELNPAFSTGFLNIKLMTDEPLNLAGFFLTVNIAGQPPSSTFTWIGANFGDPASSYVFAGNSTDQFLGLFSPVVSPATPFPPLTFSVTASDLTFFTPSQPLAAGSEFTLVRLEFFHTPLSALDTNFPVPISLGNVQLAVESSPGGFIILTPTNGGVVAQNGTITIVPEPGSLVMFAFVGMGAWFYHWQRNKVA